MTILPGRQERNQGELKMVTKYRVDFQVKNTYIEDEIFDSMMEAEMYGIQSNWPYRVVPVSVKK
jgi:hypothetical protein